MYVDVSFPTKKYKHVLLYLYALYNTVYCSQVNHMSAEQ